MRRVYDRSVYLMQVYITDFLQYIENYSRPLASEVLMLLNEVSKLHEERRSLQQYVLSLM